ncbi:MAG: hypothetical protein ABII97_00635 [Patescibacteria group bacterium]
MLPSSEKFFQSKWTSFSDIEKEIHANIIPGETTIEDLGKLGINPAKTPNLEILTSRDIVSLFLPNSSVQKLDLPAGVRKSIEAKDRGYGYRLELEIITQKRIGNFWKDQLGFKRITRTHGWKIEILILLVDNLVVYKERIKGTPLLDRTETNTKPLGPLQEFGDVIKNEIRELY